LLPNPALISANLLSTFSNLAGSFPCQFFCGSNLILDPFAPPLKSDPLKVLALSQAVLINSALVKPLFKISALISSISPSFKVQLKAGIGSCQIKSS